MWTLNARRDVVRLVAEVFREFGYEQGRHGVGRHRRSELDNPDECK